MSIMVEALKRTLWSVIRVENEYHNNFEYYRDIMVIQPIIDENDKK